MTARGRNRPETMQLQNPNQQFAALQVVIHNQDTSFLFHECKIIRTIEFRKQSSLLLVGNLTQSSVLQSTDQSQKERRPEKTRRGRESGRSEPLVKKFPRSKVRRCKA